MRIVTPGPFPTDWLAHDMHHRAAALLLFSAWLGFSTLACCDEIDEQLAVIGRAGPQAAGSDAARAAVDALANHGTDVLPRLLTAMDTDNPVAANWYRAAYESIVERALSADRPKFPVEPLRDIVADPARRGRVRRLALDLCERLEPGYRDMTLRGLFDDPEFRADAVELALTAGGTALAGGDSETAREQFQRAYDHARQPSQVTAAAAQLGKLGEQTNIAQHLGLVIDWWLLGPFDAPGTTGFGRAFPPEAQVEQVDLSASYVGPDGEPIKWIRHRTKDALGSVNLAQAIAPVKEAVGYAYAELDSPNARGAQLRVGADDNITVWLNGRQVFGREQWLNGIRFDRFTTPVKLERGTNRVLVKVCQGPRHVDPQVPNNWTFQLRFCDELGGGIPLVVRSPNHANDAP